MLIYLRYALLLFIIIGVKVNAAACLDIFPAETNDDLVNQGLEFINVPAFSPTGFLVNPQTLSLGDSQYQANFQDQEIIIDYLPANETSSRLYLTGSVAWDNAKINVGGNPEDLIIIISGALTITGGNTEINAIIYAYGDVNINGNVNIKGAVASETQVNTNPAVNISYDQTAIENADFNGMCDNTPSPPSLTCDADAAMPVIFNDDFSTIKNWQSVNFIRPANGSPGGNWPNDNRFPESSSEEQQVVFNIANELNVAGKAQVGGHNEYGMVAIDFNTELIGSTSAVGYSIFSKIDAGNIGLNNDVGIVFGYTDDQNYYLARWAKYGTSYNGNTSFPGEYREFELVRMNAGVPTKLDSVNSINLGDTFSMKVIVKDGQTAVCTGDSNGNNLQLRLSSTQSPILNDFGLFTYDNDDGVSFDDVDVRCSDCITVSVDPIAYYQMDEAFWDGTAGEVVNEVSNTLHGRAVNNAQTDDTNRARPEDIGTCGYGTFDDNRREYVQIEHDTALDFRDELTISTWIYPTRLPTGGGLMSILSKDENYEFHLDSAGRVFWWWNRASFRTNNPIGPINNWYHIAITYKSGEQVIYVNGQLAGENFSRGRLNTNRDPLQIGQDQGFNGRYFEGSIDEVKIYNTALSASQIELIYKEVHPCDNSVDHFEIDVLNSQGLTCEPDIIKIRACSDASCNTLSTDAVDVVLSVSDGSSVLLNKNVTVNGGEVDVDYVNTTAGIVSLSLNQTYECKSGVPGLCNVTFADAGFRFISASLGTSLPVQLSGKPSNVGFNADTLKVEAVKTDNTGACAPLLVTGEVIDMAASYDTPGSGTKKVNVAGVDLDMANSGTAFDSLPFKNVPLDFGSDTQHSADYILTYPDAGSLTLSARYELPDDNGDPSGEYIKGTSNPILIRPFAFDILVDNNLPQGDGNYIANPGAKSGLEPNNPVFIAAGDTMAITTRAVAWKAGDDANANGIADQNEDLTNPTANPTTENFTNINLTSLTHSLVEPILNGVLGNLVITDGGVFNSGVKVDTATYDEVGIISLGAFTSDYIIAGVSIEGAAANIGRFIPSHFYLASADVNFGILKGTCSANSTDLPFVYSGQMLSDDNTVGALSYFLAPSFTIKAKSSICPSGPDSCNTTKNYIDDFYKLPLTGFTRLTLPSGALAPDNDAVKIGKDGSLVKLTANIKTASISDVSGEITYTYSTNDHFVYLHEANSEINEFTSDIALSMVSIIDEDDVITQDYDGDSLNGLILTLHPAGKIIRFGRAQLENSYGPDTSNLPQTLSVNYFKDNDYILSEEDTCTTYNSTNILLSNISLDPVRTPIFEAVSGKFSDVLPLGITRAIILSAPTTNINVSYTGQVEVIYNISDWLKYDWAYDAEEVDGLFNDNPRGVATFGIFRGNDRIIYQREITN